VHDIPWIAAVRQPEKVTELVERYKSQEVVSHRQAIMVLNGQRDRGRSNPAVLVCVPGRDPCARCNKPIRPSDNHVVSLIRFHDPESHGYARQVAPCEQGFLSDGPTRSIPIRRCFEHDEYGTNAVSRRQPSPKWRLTIIVRSLEVRLLRRNYTGSLALSVRAGHRDARGDGGDDHRPRPRLHISCPIADQR